MRPEEHLVTHRCPPGLLESSRRPRRRAGLSLALVAAAAGLVAGVLTDRALRLAPEDHPPGSRPVTFVYRAPDARQVAVAGSFNDWDPGELPLVDGGDGLFSAVLWLPPGQYEYQVVVDGRSWRPDPLASRQRDDGFGAVNSVLDL